MPTVQHTRRHPRWLSPRERRLRSDIRLEIAVRRLENLR